MLLSLVRNRELKIKVRMGKKKWKICTLVHYEAEKKTRVEK